MRTFYKTDRALVDEFVADIEAAYAIDSITGEPIAVKDSALSSEWPDIVLTYEKARAVIDHRTPDTLRDAAPELLAALNRALPWLGRLIADGGHLNSVAPNDAIGAMNQAQAAIDKAAGNV